MSTKKKTKNHIGLVCLSRRLYEIVAFYFIADRRTSTPGYFSTGELKKSVLKTILDKFSLIEREQSSSEEPNCNITCERFTIKDSHL